MYDKENSQEDSKKNAQISPFFVVLVLTVFGGIWYLEDSFTDVEEIARHSRNEKKKTKQNKKTSGIYKWFIPILI